MPSLAGLDSRDLDEVLARAARHADALRGARIVVTGATGWFGTWLLDALVALGRRHELDLRVVAVSRRPERFAARWPVLHGAPEIEWVAADVRRPLTDVGGPVTHVIHAAADSHAKNDGAAADATPTATLVDGTRHVVDLAARHPGAKLLFVGSGAVYGAAVDAAAPMVETDPLPPVPGDAYATGKQRAEDLVRAAVDTRGLHATIARCFAFVGPHMPFDAHFAIGNFVRDAAEGRSIEVAGDGTPRRSYLYMGDLVVWLLAILLDGRPGRAYNVGSPDAVSIEALARRCAEVAGSSAPVRVRRRATGGRHYVPDVGRIVDELGVALTVPLDDAIARTLRWRRRADTGVSTRNPVEA